MLDKLDNEPGGDLAVVLVEHVQEIYLVVAPKVREDLLPVLIQQLDKLYTSPRLNLAT